MSPVTAQCFSFALSRIRKGQMLLLNNALEKPLRIMNVALSIMNGMPSARIQAEHRNDMK